MSDYHDDIVEAIPCSFKIIQSPDLEHLRIMLSQIMPDSHLDKYMLGREEDEWNCYNASIPVHLTL